MGLRRLNGELARRVEKRVREGDLSAVEQATALALAGAFGGAFLVHLLVLILAIPTTTIVVTRWPAVLPRLTVAAFPVPIAGVGAVISGAGFRLGLVWATLGFAIGLLIAARVGLW